MERISELGTSHCVECAQHLLWLLCATDALHCLHGHVELRNDGLGPQRDSCATKAQAAAIPASSVLLVVPSTRG